MYAGHVLSKSPDKFQEFIEIFAGAVRRRDGQRVSEVFIIDNGDFGSVMRIAVDAIQQLYEAGIVVAHSILCVNLSLKLLDVLKVWGIEDLAQPVFKVWGSEYEDLDGVSRHLVEEFRGLDITVTLDRKVPERAGNDRRFPGKATLVLSVYEAMRSVRFQVHAEDGKEEGVSQVRGLV